MAKSNPSLWKTMTNWLKDFVRRVKRAFCGLTATNEEAKALTEIRDGVERYVGNMQKLWDNALVDAAGRETADEVTEKKGDVVEERAYSIRKLNDGTTYVHVDTDQQIFDGIQPDAYAKAARNYIRDHYRNTVIGSKVRAYVRRETENDYTLPAKKNISKDVFQGKMRAAIELGNLLDASVFMTHEEDDGRHPDAVNGWDKYRTTFEVNNRFFEGSVTIKKIKFGDVFYDVTKIEDITQPMRAKYSEELQYPGQSDVLDKSILQSSESVNGDIQFSQRRGKPDLSVRGALMAITDFTGMTPAEESLLNRYQGNVLKPQEVTEAIAEKIAIRDNKDTPEKERAEAKTASPKAA